MTLRDRVELRAGAYHDSVTLLQVSKAVAGVEGVAAAQVAMATDLNVEVIRRMGFDVPDGAGPNDLLVAVRADGDEALAAADAALAHELTGGRRAAAGGQGVAVVPPRTVGSAARTAGGTLALVSLPGRYAFAEAHGRARGRARRDGLQRQRPGRAGGPLKDRAEERGLLVMGPDCGTAVVAGVGLGFANVVRPGPVGLVAASGTGAQQVMALLDAAGVGVGTALGVGGRDLSAAVGGRAARRALALLDADPAIELVVLVGKPPAPEVASALGETPPGWRRRCNRAAGGRPPGPDRRGGAGPACPWPRLAGAAVVAGAGATRTGRYDRLVRGLSAAARSATRPWWWPRPRWVRWPRTSRWRERHGWARTPAPRGTSWWTSATTSSPGGARTR